MKKTAVMLYDLFSNYELSVALSVLAQAQKPYEVYCLRPVAVSEEGLSVERTRALEELVIDECDSLLMPGCMDPRELVDDERVIAFLQQFDLSRHVIASISSAPILLLKAGLLEGRKYIAGLLKEGLLEEGFTMEQMSGMRDVTELGRPDGGKDRICVDGKLLTGIGAGFVEFGIEFGKLLELNFEPAWYH